MKHRRIGILGGGISGIALAAHLHDDVDVLEKAARIGGLCGTIREQGFTFDAAGPHIMFSRNKDVLRQMVEALGDNVHQRRRENRIWFKGRLVKYPFENDLSSLPPEDNFECIYGYLKNPRGDDTPHNLAEWSYATFGAGISEKYLLPYNRKIWNHDPARLSLEFVARIPRPPLEDVLRSSIGIPTEGYLHQLHFYYPVEGGYEALVHAYASRVTGSIETGTAVVSVRRNSEHWHVMLASGEERLYDELVSTLPIHELLKVWPEAPQEAVEAASRLRYNSLINVLVGLDEDRGWPYTALYVPDPEIVFHRVSFPKAFSERSVPAGQSALMAEITATEGDDIAALSDDEVVRRVVSDLEEIGFADRARVVYTRVVRFTYGYPVYDLEYRTNVETMRAAVKATGLHLLGRFAEFEYINSDICIERAIRLSESIQ